MNLKEKIKNSYTSANIAYMSLLAIMFVLLIQSGITLFTPDYSSDTIDPIDTVLRTSMSSIFGYIISVVWNKNTQSNSTTSAQSKTQIGFTADSGESVSKNVIKNAIKMETSTVDSTENQETGIAVAVAENKMSKKPQIIILAGICIYCLVVVIFWQTFETSGVYGTTVIATLGQYRDFISGGIGALIGLAKSND